MRRQVAVREAVEQLPHGNLDFTGEVISRGRTKAKNSLKLGRQAV